MQFSRLRPRSIRDTPRATTPGICSAEKRNISHPLVLSSPAMLLTTRRVEEHGTRFRRAISFFFFSGCSVRV